MKKVFLTVILTCVAAGVFAVDLPKQGFGLQIGWAQPILRLNSPDNPSYQTFPGVHWQILPLSLPDRVILIRRLTGQ